MPELQLVPFLSFKGKPIGGDYPPPPTISFPLPPKLGLKAGQ